MKVHGLAPTAIAGLLVAARLEAGLTQEELATRAGTSAPTVSAYESGHKEPRLSTLQRLLGAAGFELRVSYQPTDPNDAALANWEAELSDDTLEQWQRGHARRIDADVARTADAIASADS